LAVESGDTLRLQARVASLDGSRSVTGEEEGSVADPAALGRALGVRLLDGGAGEILAGIRNATAG
jgi:porphobilinogen deaminase